MARIPSAGDISRARRAANQRLNVQNVIASKSANRGSSNRTPDEIAVLDAQQQQAKFEMALPNPSSYVSTIDDQEFGEQTYEVLNGASLGTFAVFSPTTSLYALDASTGTTKIFNYIDNNDTLNQSINGDWTVGLPAGCPGVASMTIDTGGNAFFLMKQGDARSINKPNTSVSSQYTYLSSNSILRLTYGASSNLPRVPTCLLQSPFIDTVTQTKDFLGFNQFSEMDMDPNYRGTVNGATGDAVLYAANTDRNNIVKIIYKQTLVVNRYPSASTFSSTVQQTIIAGAGSPVTGATQSGWNDGSGASALFNYPTGLCTDIKGNVYVADKNSNKIRKITIAAGRLANDISAPYDVTTIAGTGYLTLDQPVRVAVDDALNLYVVDATHIKFLKNLETIDNPAYGTSWTATKARSTLATTADILGFATSLEGANYSVASKNALFFTFQNATYGNNIYKLVYNNSTSDFQTVSSFAISNPTAAGRVFSTLAFPKQQPWNLLSSPALTPTLTTGVQGPTQTPTPTASRQTPGATPTNTPTVTQVSTPVLYSVTSSGTNKSLWTWNFTGIANDASNVFLVYSLDGKDWVSILGTKSNGRQIQVSTPAVQDAFMYVQVLEADGSRRAVSGQARFNPVRNIFLPAAGIQQTQTPSRSTPTPTATPSPTPNYIRPTPTPTPATGTGRIVNITGESGTNKLTIHYQPWDVNEAVYFKVGTSSAVTDFYPSRYFGPMTKTSNPKNASGTIRPITITLPDAWVQESKTWYVKMTVPTGINAYVNARASAVVSFNVWTQTFSA